MSQLVPDEGPVTGTTTGEVKVSFDAGVTLVTWSGDVDLAQGLDLSAIAEDAIDRGLPVRIDASRLTFIDSTAIGFVAVLIQIGREQGWRPTIIGASRMVLETLSLAGLKSEVDLVGCADSPA